MNRKFKNIGNDIDTKILLNTESNIDNIEILFQKWVWDGIYGESIIFFNNDILNFNENEILGLVKKTAFVNKNSELTYNRKEGYTFVNFNFKS